MSVTICDLAGPSELTGCRFRIKKQNKKHSHWCGKVLLSTTFCLEIFPTKRDNYKNFTVSAYNSARKYANNNRAIWKQSLLRKFVHVYACVLTKTGGISVIHWLSLLDLFLMQMNNYLLFGFTKDVIIARKKIMITWDRIKLLFFPFFVFWSLWYTFGILFGDVLAHSLLTLCNRPFRNSAGN